MDTYSRQALYELEKWKTKMRKRPSIIDRASKGVQSKFNTVLPQGYNDIMTSAIKTLTRAVLFGSKYITKPPVENISLMERERLVTEKTKFYRTTAVIEGAATGAGGLILGMSDLPLLLSIKIKYLYDMASIYGFDVNDYRERLYILNIFQLAFSSKGHMNTVFKKMENWDDYSDYLPDDIHNFDWDTFQQEYRDYIDIAKLLQLVPGIGAVIGSYANNKLMNKLHDTAVQSYRMRILK